MQPEPLTKPNAPAPPAHQTPSNLPSEPLPPKDVEEKSEDKKKSLNIKSNIEKTLKILQKYQVPVIALTVSGLLVVTIIRMMHYASPAADDARIQENLKNFKQVHIDQKVVQQIKNLKTSNSKPKIDIENGRTNPFTE